MLRINKNDKVLVHLSTSSLSQAEHWERDLQAMILNSPDAFCDEIGERLWIVGQEIHPSEAVPDRIDILAIDDAGSAVVVELKRGSRKLQLLQAISYAGMISRWTPEQFVEALVANYKQPTDDARAAIEAHTALDISYINQAQRIVLIAEDFDPALLIASEWLHENYGVDIRCYRLQLSRENSDDYLTCTRVYPPIEIAALTRGSGLPSTRASNFPTDWDSALATVENSAVKNFFRKEVDKK